MLKKRMDNVHTHSNISMKLHVVLEDVLQYIQRRRLELNISSQVTNLKGNRQEEP